MMNRMDGNGTADHIGARGAREPARGVLRMALLGGLGLLLLACEDNGTAATPPVKASAQVRGFTDGAITGTVTFTAMPGQGGAMVEGSISGLKYGSVYAIHVHEKGNCAAPDSAGGHFHTGTEVHGNPTLAAGMHHDGDLPNLTVDSAGVGHFAIHTASLTLEQGPLYPVGRSVIVHAGPDDYVSQPSGNSGARIACGVIVLQ